MGIELARSGRMSRAERQQVWRQVIEKKKSGASIRALCRQLSIGEHLFYSWRQLAIGCPSHVRVGEILSEVAAAIIEMVDQR